MIYCIVGPSCAGKTTSSELISLLHGLNFVEASDFVRDAYYRSGYQGNLIDFVIEKFEEDKAVFAKDLWNEVQDSMTGDFVICGFRTVEEVDYISDKTDNIVCIGIFANSQLRFCRNILRREGDTIPDYSRFVHRDFLEYEFGIADLLANRCDRVLTNEGTFGELFSGIDSAVMESKSD